MATTQERNRGMGAYSSPGVDTPGSPTPTAIITSQPEVTFAFKHIAPPTSLYITRDDRLLMHAFTLFSGGDTITFTLRILRFDGVIVRSTFAIPVPTISTLVTLVEPLTEGFLLSIVATAASTLARGTTFARAFITRSGVNISDVAQCLFADYVTQFSAGTWPSGRVIMPTEGPGNSRIVLGTTPAAGAEFFVSPPTGARWRLIGIRATLTTSAAVANRTPRFRLDIAGNVYYQSGDSKVQPASTIASYSGVPGTSFFDDAIATPNESLQITLPPDLRMDSNNEIGSNTLNLQAGDQWSQPILNVEEWIDNT